MCDSRVTVALEIMEGRGMSTNETLYEETLNKISELANDTSVSQEAAIENLRGLAEHIESLIEGMEA